MARLPKPGADNGTWGDILNEYLAQAHKPDGTLKEITETQLHSDVQTKLNATGDWNTLSNKPAVIGAGANQATARTSIGLGNVDNTSDANKPVSTAQQTALDGKVAKGELVYNVKDYGAVGDGTTDDTAAIQAAINASGDVGGTESYSIVYLPAGDYRVTSTLTVKGNLWIRGAGERTFIDFTSPTSAPDNLFEWIGTSIDDFVISDMRIRGHGTDSGDGSSNGCGVYLNGSNNVDRFKARRVRVERFRYGIRVYGNIKVEGPEVRECWFDECSYASLSMNNTTDAKVIGNYVDCDRTGVGDGAAGKVGLWLGEVSTGTTGHFDAGVHNNHVYNASNEGINVHSKYASITGNNVHDCVQTGIMFEPFIKTNPDDSDARMVSTIAGNVVRGSLYNIALRRDPVNNMRDVGRISVTGNACYAGTNGIMVGHGSGTNGPTDVAVSGNVCIDQSQVGIDVVNARRVALGSNIAVGAGTAGINVREGSKLVTITGGCYNATGAAGDGIIIQQTASHITINGVTADNCGRTGVRVSGSADYVTINGLIAIDDQGSPTMDNAVVVTSTGTHVYIDGHPISSGTTSTAFSGMDSFNGYGEESANAETPTAANWQVGDVVKFTDSGDGSGTGIYILRTDGTNWHRIASAENGVINNPKINQIRDTNNGVIFDMVPVASAVNFIRTTNAATSGTPSIAAGGTDSNINLAINPKGTGAVQIYVAAGQTPKILAGGADANHNLNLIPKGTGIVQANGNPVGVKVAVPSSASATGVPGQWAADSNYIYVCTATNTWVRSAAATW